MSKFKPDHHEKPRLYLKGFCVEGKSSLWVFRRNKPFIPGKKKGGNNPVLLGLKKVGLRDDGYVVPLPNGQKDYSFELKLQQEEHKADTSLMKIRNQSKITINDKRIIAGYIILMKKRISNRDVEVEQMINKFIHSFPWGDLQKEFAFRGQFNKALQVPEALELVQSEYGKTLLIRETMMLPSPMTQAELIKMNWQFITASNDEYFVTSDNPVIYDKSQGIRKLLIFPINQRIILLTPAIQGEDLSYAPVSAELIRKINIIIIRTACNEVYSPKPDEWICQAFQ